MKALVFGSTGFIGYHLTQGLLREGYEVTGVSRKHPGKNFPSRNYRHFTFDISKREEFDPLKGNFDIVFNLAAHIVPGYATEGAVTSFLINTQGTLNVLDYMLKNNLKRLIQSSSVTVYGIPKRKTVSEKSPMNPVIVYGVTKLAAEKYCTMFSQLYNFHITLLRYAPVFGKGLTQNTALPLFIKKALKNDDIMLFGDGSRYQDYVYITDVVEANLLAAKKDIGGIYNIGSGKCYSMKELAETIIEVFQSKSKIHYNPSLKQEFSLGVDITHAKKLLGYRPQFDLESGLKDLRKYL